MTKFLSFILFWVAIVPLGKLQKLFGVQLLDRRWRDGSETYWQQRSGEGDIKQRYRSQL